jgi:hypothetical protein
MSAAKASCKLYKAASCKLQNSNDQLMLGPSYCEALINARALINAEHSDID